MQMKTLNDFETVTKQDIIAVSFTNEMKKTANQIAKEMGKLKNSFMSGERTYEGILGEQIVQDRLQQFGSVHQPTYDYDLILPFPIEAVSKDRSPIKIDVKAKSLISKIWPEISYDGSIPFNSYHSKDTQGKWQSSQNVDIYVFTRISEARSIGWIMGWLTKEEFYDKAVLRVKGSSSGNLKECRATDFVVTYDQMHPFRRLEK